MEQAQAGIQHLHQHGGVHAQLAQLQIPIAKIAPNKFVDELSGLPVIVGIHQAAGIGGGLRKANFYPAVGQTLLGD